MNLKTLSKTLGPGLLWAGAAIGVSHLVQSTRAGASFGFELVWLIILINLLKYPFFEFGPRYAAATGKTLIDGYNKLGKWAVILYAVVTISTMFTVIAAVSSVTAGLFSKIFKSSLSPLMWQIIVLAATTIFVAIGRFSVLDKLMKIIIITLSISTIFAVIAAFSKGFNPKPDLLTHFDWNNSSNIIFLIAIAGWMPSAIDISVWHSVWTIAKKESSSYTPKVKESIFDFNVGYIGTVILSLCFLSLGALTMYASGNELSTKAVAFSGQLIKLFTSGLGEWSYLIIAIATLATMVSTTITCLDAYPRVLKPTSEILIPKLKSKNKFMHYFWLTIIVLGALTILIFFMKDMSTLIDFATIMSFITAPILGYLNYKSITSDDVPDEHKPKLWLKILSWVGLVVLSLFSLYFIYIKIF